MTQRVPLVEQELPALPGHPSSPPVFRVVPIAQSFVFCVVFCKSLCALCPFSLVIVFSDLWFLASDYRSGIFDLYSSFRKFDGHHYDLVNHYCLSQLTTGYISFVVVTNRYYLFVINTSNTKDVKMKCLPFLSTWVNTQFLLGLCS